MTLSSIHDFTLEEILTLCPVGSKQRHPPFSHLFPDCQSFAHAGPATWMPFPSGPPQSLRPSSGPKPVTAFQRWRRWVQRWTVTGTRSHSQYQVSVSQLPIQRCSPASPGGLISSPSNMKIECSLSLKLTSPSPCSALENPCAHQGQKWVAGRASASIKLFIPPLPMIWSHICYQKNRCSFSPSTNILEFSKK